MPMEQGQLVHKDRTEGKTAGSYQATCGHLAMALEDSFELLMEILKRYRAGFMQEPADFPPVIGVWVRPSGGREHEATAPRAPLLEVGSVIMLVPQPKAACQGECLDETRGLEVIGHMGGCESCREGNPEPRRRADEVQFPAIPPAVPARCGPVGCGINRGMRDDAGLPVCLVPDTAQGAQHGAVNGGGTGASGPGLEQGPQGAPQPPHLSRPGGWDCRQATLPGPTARHAPLGVREQRTETGHLWRWLGQDGQALVPLMPAPPNEGFPQ
jgi:hypothetical protein